MLRARGLMLAALCVALALVVAGCGGGDSFKDDYNEKAKGFTELGQNVQAGLRDSGKKSGADVQKEFNDLAAETGKVRGDVASLDPPDDVKPQFDALLKEVDDSAASLRNFGTAAATDDPAKLREGRTKLVEDSNALIKAEVELRRAIDK
jgi:hypothetical protein